MSIQKFENYQSPEKDILIEHFKTIPMMDKWIACIIESYIYAYVEKYYDNGQLKCKYRTKFGEKDGEYKEWDCNGQLYTQTTYVNGKEHGEYNEWYGNGQLYIQKTYVNGKEHGEYKSWWDNGQLRVKTTFVEGKPR